MSSTLKPSGHLTEEEFAFELRLLFGILRTGISDAEWHKLKRITGFDDTARSAIDSALRDYWRVLIHHTVDPATRKDIATARLLIPKIIVALFELSENPDLFKGKDIHFDQSVADQREQLIIAAQTLDKADDLLGMAEERIEQGPGRKGFWLHGLVRQLDDLLFEQHGSRLKRSTNRMSNLSRCTGPKYVFEVARIAFPTVSDETVKTAMRDHIAQRDKIPSTDSDGSKGN